MKSGINATKVGQIETNRLAIVTANGEIEKNTTAISTINNSAVMKSGVNSTIVQQVGTNKTGITAVNGRVDTLEESVNGLSGSVNTLEGNVNNNTASINNISTDVNAMKTGKQDKLVAGSGITIASDGKTISTNEKPWVFMPKSEVLAMEFFDIATTGEGINKKVTSLTLKKDLKIEYSRFKKTSSSDYTLIQIGEFYLYKKSVLNKVIKNGSEYHPNSKYMMYSSGKYDAYLWYSDSSHSSVEDNSICIGYSDKGKFISLRISSYSVVKDNIDDTLSYILADSADDNSWKYYKQAPTTFINVKIYYR